MQRLELEKKKVVGAIKEVRMNTHHFRDKLEPALREFMSSCHSKEDDVWDAFKYLTALLNLMKVLQLAVIKDPNFKANAALDFKELNTKITSLS